MTTKKSSSENTEIDPPVEVDGAEVGLVTYTPPGDLATVDLFKLGFSQSETIKIDDPSENPAHIPVYAGELIGAGPDVEAQSLRKPDETVLLPTWQFHPLDVSQRPFKPIKEITHTVICSSALDGQCKRLAALATSTGKTVHAVISFAGVGKNRRGLPLKLYKVMHNLVG